MQVVVSLPNFPSDFQGVVPQGVLSLPNLPSGSRENFINLSVNHCETVAVQQ